jgi:hypothetical protein
MVGNISVCTHNPSLNIVWLEVKETKADVKEIISRMDTGERSYSLDLVSISCRSSRRDRREVSTGPQRMANSA